MQMKRLSFRLAFLGTLLLSVLVYWRPTHLPRRGGQQSNQRAETIDERQAHGRPRHPLTREQAKALAATPVEVSLGEWISIGPWNYAGKAYDVSVDPSNPTTVYSAFGSGGGLWNTADGGNTWLQLTDRSDVTHIGCVSVHPYLPDVVIACVGGVEPVPEWPSRNVPVHALNDPSPRRGLMYSTDGGRHWEWIGPHDNLSSSFYRAIFHPYNPDTIYAASEWGVYITSDRGAHWKRTLTFPLSNTDWYAFMPDLVMRPDDPTVLIVAQANLGVFRTADGGSTWTRVDQSMDPSTEGMMLAWSPSDTNIVYCERSQADDQHMLTYVPTDAGVSWKQAGTLQIRHQGRYDMALTVDPILPSRVILANADSGISEDGLQSYHPPAQPAHVDHLRVAFAPSDPNVAYSANDGGIWSSSDRAEDWSRFDSGVNTNLSFGFDVDPASGRLYLSSGDYSALQCNPAQGWFKSPYGGEWAMFYIDPSDSATVWYARNDDLAVSRNYGQTWTDVNPASTGYRPLRTVLRFDPNQRETMFLLAGDIWVSHDFGQTWADSRVPGGTSPILTDMIADPAQPGTFYVSENGGILTSKDDGATWTEHKSSTGGLPVNCGIMAPVPGQAGTFYVSAEGGIHVVSNGGENARLLPGTAALDAVRIDDLATDPGHPERIYVGTGDGFFISEDVGQSWKRLGRNLPSTNVWEILVRGDTIYASTAQGMWKFSADVSWQQPSPSDLAATATSGSSVALSWTPGKGSKGVRVYRDSAQIYVGLDKSYTDQGLTPSTKYCYTIVDTNANGDGPLSAPVCIETHSLTSGVAPSLSLSESQSAGVVQGQNGATYTVTVSDAASAGPTSGVVSVAVTIPVGFSLVSLAGSGWTCSGSTCTRGDALAAGARYPPIVVTVNVAANAPPQLPNVATVSGGSSATADVTAVTKIAALAPGFSISGSPNSAMVVPGQSATYSMSVNTESGSSRAVSLNCTGAPTDATCSISPDSVTPSGSTASSATVTVTTGSSTPAGVYTLAINAVSGSGWQSTDLTLMVQDFSISGSPSLATVVPGQSGTYTVSVTPEVGLSQAVSLSCTGAPTGATCSISPGSVTLSGSAASTATVTVATALRPARTR